MRCDSKTINQKIDFEKAPVCRKESIVQGAKYRISILTPALIRLEYNEEGVFEDRATQAVLNRDFPPVRYRVWENEAQLFIETEEREEILEFVYWMLHTKGYDDNFDDINALRDW